MDRGGALTYVQPLPRIPDPTRPMSLPPGFLDELRTRVSIAQVVGRKVSWDLRKSNQAKGDFWAPCPFHQEKSASFHVDDKKGFYYCFGCHAKGDALKFLQETQNMGFMEAVETLAREAGMALPARDPGARQQADRRDRLVAVCEAAARFWRAQLAGSAAAPAREYLDRRCLGPATRERWGLGFAADSRRHLWDHLTGAGHDPDLIVEAGLCARPDDGGAPFDRFRDRIIFPIQDARGRTIAFGGRAMAANARAKYLNSPETPIFDKGRTLYNLGPARTALAQGGPLIVAEGYVDVIALSEAGFTAAVAPLGTAVTEDQLRLLWRLSPEPVIALDGDKAGLRAGERLAELALGLIGAGQALRFALLPAGQDPDDLIRASGPAAMRAVLDGALPMSRLLWDRETAGQTFDGPERRAALDARLKALAARIPDPALREEYGAEFRQLRAALFGAARPQARRGKGGERFQPAPAAPLSSTRATRLATADEHAGETLREARLLATLAAHPAQVADFESALWALDPAHPDHRALQTALLDEVPVADLDLATGGALGRILARRDVAIAPQLRPDADPAQLSACLAEDFAVLAAARAARRETAEAEADMALHTDEGTTWRLRQAAQARDRAARGGADSAPEGGDEQHLSAHLDQLLASEAWVRRRRGPS